MHKTAKLQGTLSSTSQSSQTFIYTCKYVVKENLQKWHKNSSRSNQHTVRFCQKFGQIFQSPKKVS